jgi:large subunit ribosomal protein L30e
MADLANNIRLAVDSGKVAMGVNSVMDSIKQNNAKLIVIASKNREDILQDVQHLSKVSNIKTVMFEGNSIELGAICGKPYSISVLAVLEAGNSRILEET